MKSSVTVIDYGLGNLLSVVRALEVCGGNVQVSSDPGDIAQADRLILPGVGAFADGMRGLRDRHLLSPLRELAAQHRPLLGICLGMQLLLSEAEEFGHHEGIGLIEGSVKAIPGTGSDGETHKIPHVGWNSLSIVGEQQETSEQVQDAGLLQNLGEKPFFYFVHSFAVEPQNDDVRVADAYYNGRRISAVIKQNSVHGCQFHPEKSGEAGLRLLSNFLTLT